MSLYELLEKRLGEAEKYIKNDSKVRGALKMIGKIKVNVRTTDTKEQIGAEISTDGVELSKKALDGPAVTITGSGKRLRELVSKPSREKFEEAQRKEEIKIEPHGLKGKLVISRVKDLLSK